MEKKRSPFVFLKIFLFLKVAIIIIIIISVVFLSSGEGKSGKSEFVLDEGWKRKEQRGVRLYLSRHL